MSVYDDLFEPLDTAPTDFVPRSRRRPRAQELCRSVVEDQDRRVARRAWREQWRREHGMIREQGD